MWANLTALVQKNFPNKPIISAFGNNDNLFNYLPPGWDQPTWKIK